MERRTTLADIRNASRKRTAKREELLRQTDTAIPWRHACSARETALLRRTTGAQAYRHRAEKAPLSGPPESDQTGTSTINQRLPSARTGPNRRAA